MERKAQPLAEFCKEHGICRQTFYNLRAKGEAPRVMRVGRKVLVSAEAAADWRREREVA